MSSKILKRKYGCACDGCVAPRAICGKVSIAHDSKGHRCMAHGNFKCTYKVNLDEQQTDSNKAQSN